MNHAETSNISLINQAVPEMRTCLETCTGVIRTLVLTVAAAHTAVSADVSVSVTDRSGDPISNVAVYLVPTDRNLLTTEQAFRQPAAMAQIDGAFVPQMMVVQTGTEISFPNNDTISHHVYSFSEAKTFQLDLYRGNVHPPQLFDKAGLVVLGCNIHDSMLGFIVVVDTPHSSITSADGTAYFTGLPAGTFELHTWTPRAKPRNLPEPQTIVVTESGNRAISIEVAGKLNPPPGSSTGSLNWESY